MSGATSGAIHVAATRASLEILREELIRRKHLAPHWGDYGPILLALVDVVLHSVLNATEIAESPRKEPSPCDCEREAIPCAECQDRKMQEQLRELERSTEIAESPRKEPSPIAANEAISQQLGTAGIWEGCDVEVSPAEIAACMAAECEDEEEPFTVCAECGESCPYPQAAKVEPSPVCADCGMVRTREGEQFVKSQVDDRTLCLPCRNADVDDSEEKDAAIRLAQLCGDDDAADEAAASKPKVEPSHHYGPECESCNGVQCDAARAGAYCPAEGQSMNNVRMGRSILLGLAKKSGRCTFHDDVHAKGNPIGEPCGCPAVKLLIWHDGSFSLACAKHTENVLSDEARELLRDVVHIGKASL